MIYYFLDLLKEFFSPLNVFQYITFRSAAAAILAAFVALTAAYISDSRSGVEIASRSLQRNLCAPSPQCKTNKHSIFQRIFRTQRFALENLLFRHMEFCVLYWKLMELNEIYEHSNNTNNSSSL